MPARSERRSARRGFTLIEMLAAVCLAALLAAAVAVSAVAIGRDSELREAIEKVRLADRLTREAARSCARPLVLRFDATAGIISRTGAGADPAQPAHEMVRLPNGVEIRHMRAPGGQEFFGGMTVPVSPTGLSRSFAIELVQNARSRWLTVAGLTGQVTETTDERKAASILEQDGARDDAD